MHVCLNRRLKMKNHMLVCGVEDDKCNFSFAWPFYKTVGLVEDRKKNSILVNHIVE